MANVTFPGINQVQSAIGTNSLGPHPGVAVLRILPQIGSPQSAGDLTFVNGVESVTWHNAQLDQASLEITTNGHIVSCRVFDRRFWWKFTTVTGVYNEQRSDGTIYSGTEKSPQELASILLDAIGEQSYSVSALPDDESDRPFVNWLCSNPAYELHRLCRDRGCDIALNHKTNRVSIVRLGFGPPVTPDDVQSASFGIDVGEYPERLTVCFDRTIWQAKLLLEAVGMDTDGTIKPIDDLSYKPADGWGLQDPTNLIPDSSIEEWVLANQWIWRTYRIKAFADGTLTIPGGDAGTNDIDSIEQVLPIGDTLLDIDVDPLSGRVEQLPARVEGKFFIFDYVERVGVDANSDLGTTYPYRFRIIEDRGLVIFDAPVAKIGDGDDVGKIVSADLYLLTTFGIRDNEYHQYHHYERTRTLPGGTGEYPIVRPDYAAIIKAHYDPDDPTSLRDPDPTTHNLEELDSLAEAILDDSMSQFQTVRSLEVVYRSVKEIDVDGVTRQVTHKVSRFSGANTRISQNSEVEIGIMREREREQLSQFRQGKQVNDEGAKAIREHSRRRRRLK